MPETTANSETRLFADDTILFRKISNLEDNRLLQEDLTALEDWESKLQMDFNLIKCTVIIIQPSKSKPIIPTNYHLHGHILENTLE